MADKERAEENELSGKNIYDLEERTFLFAKDVRRFIKKLELTISNREDAKQLARSSGSVAANYIEVNEHLGPKDILMKVRICKKEAKESVLRLRLAEVKVEDETLRQALIGEGNELKKILGAIYKKLINNGKPEVAGISPI